MGWSCQGDRLYGMNQLEIEFVAQRPNRLVRVSRPYSAGGKVFTFDVHSTAGEYLPKSRFKFLYVVEYMPRLKCHRVRRGVPLGSHGWVNNDFISLSKHWNKHVDTPSMSDAMSVLEDMISEEVMKWK